MFESWLAIVMGWLAIILAIVCSAVGIRMRRPWWVVVGAVIATPFIWYLTMSPRFRYVGPLISLLHFGAAYGVAKGQHWLAWCLFAPFVVVGAWLAQTVLRQ